MLAEKSVIGAILLDSKKFPVVRQILSASDFRDQNYKRVFEVMDNLYKKEYEITPVAIHSKDENIKASFLAEIMASVVSPSFAEQDAKIVKDKSLSRQIVGYGKQISAAGESESIEEAEDKMIDSLKRLNENKIKKERSLDDILEAVLVEQFEDRVRGIDTGIKQIDKMTVGLKGGHFWIIGAQYKTGKTLLAMEIMRRVARKHKTFFYTLEMGDDELVSRLLWQERGNKDKNKAIDAIHSMNDNLYIFDNKFRLAQIESHILSQEVKPKLVFVDYIGLVETSDKKEYERISNVSRSLKLLARRAGVCIIALSQISNESINNKTKTVGYKGSGNIAADVDVGMVLYRDLEEHTEDVSFTCDIKLNRHGRTGKIGFEFNIETGRIIL